MRSSTSPPGPGAAAGVAGAVVVVVVVAGAAVAVAAGAGAVAAAAAGAARRLHSGQRAARKRDGMGDGMRDGVGHGHSIGRGVIVASCARLHTSRLVELALRQASGLHHSATCRLGRGAWHGGRKGAWLAIGKLLIGEGRVG